MMQRWCFQALLALLVLLVSSFNGYGGTIAWITRSRAVASKRSIVPHACLRGMSGRGFGLFRVWHRNSEEFIYARLAHVNVIGLLFLTDGSRSRVFVASCSR